MKIQRIKGIVIQNLFHLRHSLEDLVDTFFWPLIDIIVWGLMTAYFTQLKGPVGGLVVFLMGGLILWNIVWRAQQDVSVSLLRNVWSRNLLNLFSSPLTVWEFFAATMMVGILKIILTLLVVSTIAFLLYSFNIFSLGFYLLPFFASLILFAWAAGIFITGLIIRFGMRVQAIAWGLISLLHPVSAVFYPVSVLPSFFQKIAWFLPTSHIFEGMRQVLKEGKLSSEHLVLAFVFNVIYLILAYLFFNFMFEKARENGRLANSEV